jgi:hypothetical protein
MFKADDFEKGIKQNFKPYSEVIDNFSNNLLIKTKYDIVNIEWTHDGSLLSVILKESDRHF